MAKLLSTATWPDDGKPYPDYPVEFQLIFDTDKSGKDSDWLSCQIILQLQRQSDSAKEAVFESRSQILRRDLQRLVSDIKEFLQQPSMNTLTFVPLTPSFEMWIQHLSDEQFRVIIWQDLAEQFNGASNIAHRGLRFTSNRTRLMGFARSLDTDVQS
jgi:hypothetical protein